MRFDAESLDVALREAAPGAPAAPGLWEELEGRAALRRRADRRRRIAFGAATATIMIAGGATAAVVVGLRRQEVDVLTSAAAGPPIETGVQTNGPGTGRSWWEGVRTSADGRQLVFTFTGGPPFVDGDPCSVDYTGVAREEAGRVVVERRARAGGELAEDQGCAAVGYGRTVTVDLAAPLAGRPVVDASSGITGTAFPGERLWELPSLPAGWVITSDGGAVDGSGAIWSRGFGPGDGTSVGVSIQQGPPSWLAARAAQAGRTQEREVTIHGLPATTFLDGGGWNVTWIEDGGATNVSARSLDGRSMESPDALLALAESLRPLGPT